MFYKRQKEIHGLVPLAQELDLTMGLWLLTLTHDQDLAIQAQDRLQQRRHWATIQFGRQRKLTLPARTNR